MDISKPFGRWRIADDNPRIGDRSSVYRVVCIDDPSFRAVLKICTSPDEDVVRAFRKEIENTKSQPIPGRMPVVYDDGEDGGHPWFVMSFSEDVKMGRKDTDLAVRVALFLIDCAIALREQGFIHCDLKPENVGIETGPDGEEHFVLRDWETLREMTPPTCARASWGRGTTVRRRSTTPGIATSGRRSMPSAGPSSRCFRS